jgi:hypothetical protein
MFKETQTRQLPYVCNIEYNVIQYISIAIDIGSTPTQAASGADDRSGYGAKNRNYPVSARPGVSGTNHVRAITAETAKLRSCSDIRIPQNSSEKLEG